MKICSACLLGVNCRYDGNAKPDEKVLKLAKEEILIPICPEQLGGLSTPRKPAEQQGEKVITKDGEDVTENFNRGGQQVLRIAKLLNIKTAILKQRSPSCGCGKIYDGTFSETIVVGDGVIAKLLKENGIEILTEDDL